MHKEERKTFSRFSEIADRYFPNESNDEKENILKDNPKLLGEHLATQALKRCKRRTF